MGPGRVGPGWPGALGCLLHSRRCLARRCRAVGRVAALRARVVVAVAQGRMQVQVLLLRVPRVWLGVCCLAQEPAWPAVVPLDQLLHPSAQL